MAVTKIDDVLISDTFLFESKYGSYSDAIVMSEEEYNKLSEEDIAAIKQQRFDNWINHIENPEPDQQSVVDSAVTQ